MTKCNGNQQLCQNPPCARRLLSLLGDVHRFAPTLAAAKEALLGGVGASHAEKLPYLWDSISMNRAKCSRHDWHTAYMWKQSAAVSSSCERRT